MLPLISATASGQTGGYSDSEKHTYKWLILNIIKVNHMIPRVLIVLI